MQRKNEAVQHDQNKHPELSITLNYHKHPEVGGVGHISLEGQAGDEKVRLSIYPDTTPRITTPLAAITGFLFPIKATNHEPKTEEPVYRSYHVSRQMEDPRAAFKEMKRIHHSIEEGSAGYSLVPNTVTQILHSLFSSKSSAVNIMRGFKTSQRELIDEEVRKVSVTNCADSARLVLKKGGISLSPDCFSYSTPSGINQFFTKREETMPSTEKNHSKILTFKSSI